MRKIISFFFLFLFTFSLLTINLDSVVCVSANIVIENWDSYNIGVQSGTSSYAYFTSTGDFSIKNAYVTSSPLSIGQNDLTPSGTFTLNITGSYDYVSSIRINFSYACTYIGTTNIIQNFYLGNDTGNKVHFQIEFYRSGASSVLYYRNYDVFGVVHEITQWNTAAANGYLEIKHVSGNTLNYTAKLNFGSTYRQDSSMVTHDFTDINYLYVITSYTNLNLNAYSFYVDDISINTEGGDSDFTPCGDLSSFRTIGDNTGTYGIYVPKPWIHEEYNVISNFTIKHIQLKILNYMFLSDSDLNNYMCRVQGGLNNVADCSYLDSNPLYRILQWDVDIDIQNEEVYLDFYHPIYGETNYWSAVFSNNYDQDFDGNHMVLWGTLSGGSTGFYDSFIIRNDLDLAYKIFYEQEYYELPCLHQNNISISGQFPYYTYVPFDVIYSIEDNSYLNYLNVTINNTIYPSYSNKVLSKCDGTVTIFPDISGIYVFNLTKNGVTIISRTINVLPNPNQDLILTIFPETGEMNKDINLFYRFFKGSQTGRILIKENDNTIIDTIELEQNSTELINYHIPYCSEPYEPDKTCPWGYSFTMYNFNGANYSFILKRIYVINVFGYYSISINNERPVKLPRDRTGKEITIRTISQDSLADVRINKDTIIRENVIVGDDLFNYKIYTPGTYFLELGYLTDTGFQSIANYSFSAVWETESTGSEFPLIPAPYSYFAGLFVTLGMLLFPFFILKNKLDLSSFVATVVSLMTGLIGLCISVLLGFFPLWVPLVVLFGTVLIILLVWISRKIGT